MKKIILILMLSLSCIACKNNSEENSKDQSEISFDRQKWLTKDGEDYPYRNNMLNDLVSSGRIKNLNKPGVLNLLGEPTRTDNNYFFYVIAQERLSSWPLHTKSLVIKFKTDGSVEWVKTHE